MAEIQRYEIQWTHGGPTDQFSVLHVTVPHGNWVKHADHLRAVKELQAQVERLTRPVERAELERPYSGSGLVGDANRFNALIASRTKEQG